METVRCGKERVVDQLSQDIHSQHKSALIHFVLDQNTSTNRFQCVVCIRTFNQ